MNNMKRYACDCIKQADDSAERLRNMANVIGNEQRYEDGVCTTDDVQRMMKNGIKKTATDMQNLIRTMADQLDAERAEVERMKRLYGMARKDSREMQEVNIRLMGDKEEAMLAEVELQRTINELKAKAQ